MGHNNRGRSETAQTIKSRRRTSSSSTAGPFSSQKSISGSQKLTTPWIEQVFQKRECARFIPSNIKKDANKCGCGRSRQCHSLAALNPVVLAPSASTADISETKSNDERTACQSNDVHMDDDRWTIGRHTVVDNTDSFGTIEFMGGPHPLKAQYVRLGFDSDPADIMYLFEKVWQMEPPKLVITVHGGIANFDVQAKLGRVFRKGVLKAAKTTGAWIITSGINAGVVRHVAAALEGCGAYPRSRSKIVTIGVAPWGLLKKRDDFIGRDVTVPYHPHAFSPKGRFAVLNDRHSYFLLVDNGTVGRYGADIILRKRLEEYISQKQTIEGGVRRVPVVCVLLEGGTCTIRALLDYVTNIPPVPVVVCDGSGRASDLIAFAHQYVQEDGSLPEGVRPQLLSLVQNVFGYNDQNADKVILELLLCVKKRHLITVFRLGEDQQQDVDHAILTALLKGQNLSAPDQLSLALAWNRVDIARSDIFILGQEWPPLALHSAMMDALVYNRVDFVRLLLENGVSMEKFLTFHRLEQLYNTDKGPPNTLYYIVRDVVRIGHNYRYTLPDIGLAMEKLMGSAYQSVYTSREFRIKYALQKQLNEQQTNRVAPLQSDTAGVTNFSMRETNCEAEKADDEQTSSVTTEDPDFKYPFNDLLLWAVLTKRQDMAICMWEHGEEAMAKALVACRILKCLAKEAAEDYLEVEICEELRKFAEEFRVLALELLDHCYKQDDDQTLQLLTYELRNWGKHTCLSLAVIANNKEFLAHPCCQILLADLWHGGLRIRSHSNLKVIMGLLFPPSILLLEFKSREELMQQPQTAAEHAQDLSQQQLDTSASSDTESSSSVSDWDGQVEDRAGAAPSRSAADPEAALARNTSHAASLQSINLTSLFTKRNRRKQRVSKYRKKSSTHSRDGTSHWLQTATDTAVNRHHSHRTGHSSPKTQRRVNETSQALTTLSVPLAKITATKRQSRSAMPTSKSTVAFKDSSPKGHHGGSLPNIGVAQAATSVTATRSPRSLRVRRKLYEFYVAPVTTFWAWTFSYIVFLIAFSYVLLIETPPIPSAVECFLVAYVASYGLELFRKLIMCEPAQLAQKVQVFFNRYWNYVSAVAVLTFAIGFAFRLVAETSYSVGRIILAVNSVFWFIKLLDFMSVHPKLGPYITMAAKMVLNMSYIIVMLLVTLMAFGVARQSITYPKEQWNWILVRNIFYKPYFMLYGEVYAGEIDTCNDKVYDYHLQHGQSITDVFNNKSITATNCVPGGWIPPILMTIFLLVANILLINILIAIFNNIFNETNAVSQQVWLFQRYEQVMEYESTPFLPPPLTPVHHLYMLVKFCYIRCRGGRVASKHRSATLQYPKRDIFDFSLKLFLDDDQVEKLHDFEEDCMDDLARNKEYERNVSMEERIQRTADRSEFMSIKLNDLVSRELSLRNTVGDIESRLGAIENNQQEILSCLHRLLDSQGTPTQRSFQPIDSLRPLSAAQASREHKMALQLLNSNKPDVLVKVAKGLSDDLFYLPSDADNPESKEHTHLSENDYEMEGGELEEEKQKRRVSEKPKEGMTIEVRPDLHRSVTVCGDLPVSHHLGTSPRIRKNTEYTSITDTITVEVVGGNSHSSRVSVAEEVDQFLIDDISYRKADATFMRSQNVMLRQFEETGSRITGGLMEDRMRNERDAQLNDYLYCLHSTNSASLDSLTSVDYLRQLPLPVPSTTHSDN